MKAEGIREAIKRLGDSDPPSIAPGYYAREIAGAILEVAAQLAQLNERLEIVTANGCVNVIKFDP